MIDWYEFVLIIIINIISMVLSLAIILKRMIKYIFHQLRSTKANAVKSDRPPGLWDIIGMVASQPAGQKLITAFAEKMIMGEKKK